MMGQTLAAGFATPHAAVGRALDSCLGLHGRGTMSMRGQIDVVVPQSRRVRAAGDGDVFKQDTRWLAFTQPRTEYRYLQALHTRKHKRITLGATVGALILLLLGFVTPHWTEKVRQGAWACDV